MEKVRIALQHIGRISYAQMVELGSPSMNRGLAPDLAASEPSLDYGQKALDIASAAYLAELSFISNTVSNHVQPAEMHNQSVNSLALISARFTITAVQLTQMILSNLLLSLCQAVDLRAMYAGFFSAMERQVVDVLSTTIQPPLPANELQEIGYFITRQAKVSFRETSTLDTDERFYAMCRPLIADVLSILETKSVSREHVFSGQKFQVGLASSLSALWRSNRATYFKNGTAEEFLGRGTKMLYRWVRNVLGIRMRRGIQFDEENTDAAVSRIYAGLVRGEVNSVLMAIFERQDEI